MTLRARLTGLAATLTLLGILLGVPAALIGSAPPPSRTPSPPWTRSARR